MADLEPRIGPDMFRPVVVILARTAGFGGRLRVLGIRALRAWRYSDGAAPFPATLAAALDYRGPSALDPWNAGRSEGGKKVVGVQGFEPQ